MTFRRFRILVLLGVLAAYGERLTIRVSLDQYTQALHEAERGPKTFAKSLTALDWLSAEGFKTAIAGRSCWNEYEHDARNGYAALIAERGRLFASLPAGGRIVEIGNHDQLMAVEGHYYKLYQAQARNVDTEDTLQRAFDAPKTHTE